MAIELKPCPICGNIKLKVICSKQIGVPSGDSGWSAKIECVCGMNMQSWALKKNWASASLIEKWNRRANNA